MPVSANGKMTTEKARSASANESEMFMPASSRWRGRCLGLLLSGLAGCWLGKFDCGLAASPVRARQPAQVAPTQAALELSLKQAVAIALEKDGNAKVRLAEQAIRQARAQSAQERAALLPNLDASVSQQSRTTNLEALGIQFDVPIPGFDAPRFVGPFGTFDARVKATQTLFDLSAVRRFQASKAGVSVAELQNETTGNEVTALVAARYLASVRADARLHAARANADLAQTLLDLTLSQKRAGTGIGIEVTRAEVQLANERQQLLLAENERRRAHLELLRAIGLGLETEITLRQELEHRPTAVGSLAEAVEVALSSRPDFQAQKKREERVKLQSSAAKWERLPSLHGFADYGSLGTRINNSLPTRSIGISVTVPVFDGGRLDARRAEVLSLFDQERIKSEDLREQIQLEVRVSLDSLQSAEAQVKVAEEGLQLATAELEQAQRRYRSGITTTVEVTDAQTRLQRARENRIGALFQFNTAKIELGQAMGTIRSMVESGQLGD
jgi:outer membrane protein